MAASNLLDVVVKEFCLPITYIVRLDSIVYKPLYIGSFFIGLFLGILIAMPLVILYSKHWSVNRKYIGKGFDIESFYMCCRQIHTTKFAVLLPAKMVSSRTFQQTTVTTEEKTEMNVVKKTEVSNFHGCHRGMVEVLLQKNSEAVLKEVTEQDIGVLEKIEKDQDKEKEKMMMNMLEKILLEESADGALPKDFSIDDFMKNVERDSQEINEMGTTERAEAKEVIKREKLFKKTPSDIDLGFDKERGITNRLKREMKKEKIKKLRNNFHQANIDYPVADRIKEKLEHLSTTWDKCCTLEQNRMSENLHKRQWNRRMDAEKKILSQMGEDQPLDESAPLLSNALNAFASNGQLTNKRVKELIDEYKRNMMQRRKQLDEDINQQQEILARKLREERMSELKKLEDKHAAEKQRLLEACKANQNSDGESNIQNYLSGMTEMNTEFENKLDELDRKEAEAMGLFLMQVNQSRAAGLQDAELEFIDNLKTRENFNQNDVQKLIHQYREQQKKYAEMCEKTRRERQLLFEEQLKKQSQEEKERKRMAEAEQEAILNEQQTIVTKMLEDNADIDEEKKEEILKIHKQKMQQLCNHMETTRMKQEQNLQVLLAQRRAKLQELREQKEKASKDKTQGENQELQEKLNAEIEAAELKLEKEKIAAEEKLRQQLMEETRAILEQQQNELAADIGKLEIAKARRKALIDRQNNTLQCLQEKLEGLVDSERTPQGLSNQIVQHHQNVMHHLEQQQRAKKEKHQRILQDKIEQKHLQKQRELSEQFNEEKREESQTLKQKGISAAASILSNALIEKRHEDDMAALQKEMKAELEKHQRELDAALEKKMDQELKQQRQNFLVELAAISDLDKDEIKDLISQAVEETGASEKTEKKLTQNFTKELEKAKTELGVAEEEKY